MARRGLERAPLALSLHLDRQAVRQRDAQPVDLRRRQPGLRDALLLAPTEPLRVCMVEAQPRLADRKRQQEIKRRAAATQGVRKRSERDGK